MPSVALAMMVRDEASTIDRCLVSARPFISSWLICDTGSTDATPDLIATRLRDISGRLIKSRWRNFGDNRTELLQWARGQAEYLLLLDADMTVAGDPVTLSEITDAGYYLPVEEGPMRYWMPYLIKADLPWGYVGVTHEALVCDVPVTFRRWPAVRIVHHADGGNRHGKFERDRQLLTAVLRERPGDSRAMFYLARTYHALGDVAQAITWYRRRVAVGGWAEEMFYAQVQVGILEAQRDWTAAVEAFRAAHAMRPWRAEPWYYLAVGWGQHGQWPLAYLASLEGLRLAEPENELLFVEPWISRWGLHWEHGKAAYHMGFWWEAISEWNVVLREPTLTAAWRDHVKEWQRRALERERPEEGGTVGSVARDPVEGIGLRGPTD